MARGLSLVQVDGLPQLRRRLRRVEGGLAELKTEHRWIADHVRNRAAPATPRRTGRLAGSVRSSGTNTASIVRAGSARIPYAGPIHYGWPARHIRPQPFIIDAARASEPTWTNHFNTTLERLVDSLD